MRPITAEEEFSKNTELKKEDIEYLREWMSTQPHLPNGVTDEQLILFLHCCQHRLEECKQIIETYYTIRTRSPDLFGNRDPRGNDVQRNLSICEFAALPKRDQNGNVLLAGRIVDSDASKFSHMECVKTWMMVEDVTMLETGIVPGYVFINDSKGSGLGHLARISLSTFKTYVNYVQNAFPANVVAMHLVNASFVTKAIFAVVKPFVHTELLSKMFIHTSMDSLYEHISKDALPKEYGGNLDSLTTYHKETVEKLERYRDWFKAEETFRVDESKRPGKSKKTEKVVDNKDPMKTVDLDEQ